VYNIYLVILQLFGNVMRLCDLEEELASPGSRVTRNEAGFEETRPLASSGSSVTRNRAVGVVLGAQLRETGLFDSFRSSISRNGPGVVGVPWGLN